MRRKGAEFRRPARRGLTAWIWRLLLIFAILIAVIFVIRIHWEDSLPGPRLSGREPKSEAVDPATELSSATSFSRQLVDQMTLAKAYLVLAKEQGKLTLAMDLSSQIRNSQQLLSRAAVRERPITHDEAQPVITKLAQLLLQALESHFDIATTLVTLKHHIQALEARVHSGTVQSAEFGKQVSESVPKHIHCLSMNLTVDYLSNPSLQKSQTKILDDGLLHFCLFSDNLLAASVVVNSTVSNAVHPRNIAFHVVTDSASFIAMKAWFAMNSFQGCNVEVRSVEEFSCLNGSPSPRVMRFFIPEMFPSLKKVVFLDDDVVVQKDLSGLFSMDLHGNVNGAVETCLEAFHRYNKYLNFSDPLISSRFDPQGCGWAFGMNVFDLVAWRKANLTEVYRFWEERNSNGVLWRSNGTLAAGLLTFHGRTEPLDRRWHVLGLGFDPDIDSRLIESAAVVHFSGRMKPWLKISLNKYRPLWDRYLDHASVHLRGCPNFFGKNSREPELVIE
ncbi:hexosyltransferase GAUT11-like [Wolffia australiana]